MIKENDKKVELLEDEIINQKKENAKLSDENNDKENQIKKLNIQNKKLE